MFRHPMVIFANKTYLILDTIFMLICLLTQYKYVMVDPSYIPNIVNKIAMFLILDYSYMYIELERNRLER